MCKFSDSLNSVMKGAKVHKQKRLLSNGEKLLKKYVYPNTYSETLRQSSFQSDASKYFTFYLFQTYTFLKFCNLRQYWKTKKKKERKRNEENNHPNLIVLYTYIYKQFYIPLNHRCDSSIFRIETICTHVKIV